MAMLNSSSMSMTIWTTSRESAPRSFTIEATSTTCDFSIANCATMMLHTRSAIPVLAFPCGSPCAVTAIPPAGALERDAGGHIFFDPGGRPRRARPAARSRLRASEGGTRCHCARTRFKLLMGIEPSTLQIPQASSPPAFNIRSD